MKKNAFNIMVVFAVLSFMACLAPFAFAQDTSSDDADSQQKTVLQRQAKMRNIAKFQQNAKRLGAEALTEEQIEKLKEARTAFKTATQDLNMQLQSRKLALQSELVKKEPNAKTAKAIQKEISSLTAELAMKRLEQILEMKKIAPYGGTGQGQFGNNKEGMPASRGRNT